MLSDCDLIVFAGTLFSSQTTSIRRDAAMAIANGVILDLADRRDIEAKWNGARTIDATDAFVHPGFIDPHNHTSFYLCRGTLKQAKEPTTTGDEFERWYDGIQPAEEYINALALFVEAARSGYTTIQDPGTAFYTDQIASAARAVGIRCSLADPYIWDTEEAAKYSITVQKAPAEEHYWRDVLGTEVRRHQGNDGRVRGHVALYGDATASDTLIIEGKNRAREVGAVFAMHQSFSHESVAVASERYGEPPIVHLDRLGVLDELTALTHLNVITDEEMNILGERGTVAIWCPQNQLFYGMTEAAGRLAKHAIAGGRVALCNDIPKAWSVGDPPLIANFAARSAGVQLDAACLLNMLTTGGAAGVGMTDMVGSLEVGKRADFVIRRYDTPFSQPHTDPLHQHALISREKSIDTVVVDGRVIVRNKQCTLVDERYIRDQARAAAIRIGNRFARVSLRGVRCGE